MSPIKVDPPILQSSGQGIQSEGQNISSAGGKVLGAAEGAPSYDGQFGPRVSAIGQEAYAKLGSSGNQLDDIGARVSSKGLEFQAVDDASLADMGNVVTFPPFDLTGPISYTSGMFTDPTTSILQLGNLIDTAGNDWNQVMNFIYAPHILKPTALWDYETPTEDTGFGGITPLKLSLDRVSAGEGEGGFEGDGIWAEYQDVNAETNWWAGNKNFGLTGTGTVKVGDVGGYDGYYDREFGVGVNADAASVEGDVGFNIAGYNIGLSGKFSLGFDLGVGTEISAPVGLLIGLPLSASVGLHFGPAIGN